MLHTSKSTWDSFERSRGFFCYQRSVGICFGKRFHDGWRAALFGKSGCTVRLTSQTAP